MKTLRKTLFKAVSPGESVMELNPKINKDKWGFTAKEQSEGVRGWKITSRTHQGEGHSR